MRNKKMKYTVLALAVIVLIAAVFTAINFNKPESHLLNLPAREQWENDHGYCGETSIQTDALYFGTYISQDLARKIAGGELIVSENDDELLNALKLDFDEWNYDEPVPQYKSYLVWTKKHIEEGHPVIITVYVKGMDDPDFDHIVPVVGYRSQDSDKYHANDWLIFNDNFEKQPFTRTFDSIWDVRSMKRNDGKYEYCIPKKVDYGVAITGIVDMDKETVPVSLSIDSWNEPNVTLGETPITLNATIHIQSLTPGQKYVLLKYTDIAQVPEKDFINSSGERVASFVADESSMTLTDSFLSDTLAVYRCVRAEE